MSEIQIYEMSDLKEIIDKYSQGVDDLNTIDWTKEQKREIEKATMSIVSAANIYLGENISFTGAFGAKIRRQISYTLEAPAAVNTTSTGLVTKLNLYINPLWMTYKLGVKSEGTFLEKFADIAALIEHEYFHLLYDHMGIYEYYWKNGYGRVANIATDASINQDDFIAASKPLMEYGITLESVRELTGDPNLPAKADSLTYFEPLYKAAEKQKKNKNQQGNQQGQSGQAGGSGSGQGMSGEQSGKPGQGSGNGQGQGDQNQQGSGSGSILDEDPKNPMGKNASHSTWYESPKDADQEASEQVASTQDARNAITEAVSQAAQESQVSAQDLKSRGLVAGGILDALLSGHATSGKLPIKSVLQRGAGRLKMGDKRTYARVNHQQGDRINIRRGHKKLNQKNLRVFVDNSGSMGANEIEWAVKEIAAVAKSIKAKLTITPFDAQVYPEHAQEVSKNGTYSYEPVGRGGTSFQPVFDYAKESGANNNTDMIVILSDGYGESEVDTHGLNNVVWILVESDSDTLSVENPVGFVAWLEDDQKYHLHKMSSK